MLRIHLFANLRAFDGDVALPPPHPPNLLALWAYLLLRRDRPVPRDQVAFALWPDVPEAEARANLRRHLHLLRRYLPPTPTDRSWFLADRQTIQWNPDADYWLDVQEFERLADSRWQMADGSPNLDAISHLQSAISLYRGDLLENLYDDWVVPFRDRLSQRYIRVLERLTALHGATGDLPAAIATAQRMLAHDCLREETHRLVMGLYYLAGDRAAALRQFDECRRLLRDELDVEPMVDTLALCQAIKNSQPLEQVFQLLYPALPIEFPPRKSLEAILNNLPVQLTSFVGREREIAEVKRWLSTTRLLTLTGSGGCGKTRLALQVATELLKEYADGVWWVELAALTDPALVTQAVASVLSVREEPKRPLQATLAAYLRPRQVLLVLDNCEHLVEACAALADSLLRACPKLRILVTSREPLRIAGELTWRVPSLSLPDPRYRPPVGADLVPALTQYEAIRLFIERARFSQPGFALTNQNATTVAQICRRLDGIPLAIELAAARVRVLSVAQICRRLDDCFRLLTGGGRTTPRRHQTLRAALDWSYDLLPEAEQGLFNRLSVFAGGFTLEAAEAVCAVPRGSPGPSTRWAIERDEILDLLSKLVDKSLVVAEQNAGPAVRYRLLETLRQYGGQRLAESGEAEVTRRRHATYYLALVEAIDLSRPEQGTLNQLEREHDNLRAALHWWLESGEDEAGLRLGGALWRFWYLRGYYREGRERLARLLALAGAARRTAAGAETLHGAGAMAWVQGDYAAARSLLEESLAIRRESGDRQGIADALNKLGTVAYSQGDYAAARAFYEESLALRRELGDRLGIAGSLHNLGLVAHDQGDYAKARAFYEESLAIFRGLGDREGTANALLNLATVASDQGDYAAARTLLEENLALRRELGHRLGIAYSLELFVGLAVVQAQPARAVRLAGAAAALREAIGAPLPPVEQARLAGHLETARQALGEVAFVAAWAEGQAMTLEQAIAYALAE